MTTRAFTLALALLIAACGGAPSDEAPMDEATPETEAASEQTVDMGPMEYDASGTMECAVGGPSWNEACGWRVVRDGSGGAEIWISNIASETKPAYRVLTFSEGDFTTRDGTPVQVSREGDMWVVSAADGGYFRFPDALVTGG